MSNWKKIPHHTGYEASDKGEIRSVDREIKAKGVTGGTRLMRGRVLKPHKNEKGYKRVALSIHGKPRMRQVHRLVLLAFVGIDDKRPHVDHIDGNPSNNKVGNLRWVTPRENSLSSRKRVGNGWKLTVADVLSIRARLESGESGYKIAREFSVTSQAIHYIKHRVNWKHI